MAERLHAGREAGSMGSLGFMSPELFDHLLTYLAAEDLARLSMTNHVFKVLLLCLPSLVTSRESGD